MLTLVCVANHTLESAAAALRAANAPDCTLLPSLGYTREWGTETGVVAVMARPKTPAGGSVKGTREAFGRAVYTVAVVLMRSSSQPGGENAAFVIPGDRDAFIEENPDKRKMAV